MVAKNFVVWNHGRHAFENSNTKHILSSNSSVSMNHAGRTYEHNLFFGNIKDHKIQNRSQLVPSTKAQLPENRKGRGP